MQQKCANDDFSGGFFNTTQTFDRYVHKLRVRRNRAMQLCNWTVREGSKIQKCRLKERKQREEESEVEK